jgi:hypothetical protein
MLPPVVTSAIVDKFPIAPWSAMAHGGCTGSARASVGSAIVDATDTSGNQYNLFMHTQVHFFLFSVVLRIEWLSSNLSRSQKTCAHNHRSHNSSAQGIMRNAGLSSDAPTVRAVLKAAAQRTPGLHLVH